MRRVGGPISKWLALPAMAAAGLVVLAPTVAAAAPGKEVCSADDDRLVELSGIVATADGYVVINDGSDVERRRRVFLLDGRCQVTKAVSFPSRALDPEDLALSPDRKTLLIGDIGDNDAKRETIAVWKMPVDGSKKPTIFRLQYPDGPKDAEGLLVGADGLPIIITKGAKAGIYKPTGALTKDAPTRLKRVGELSLPKTTTSNPFGPLGRVSVSGAALAPDGSRVVLRTLADAFEWDVANGDIVAALTSGQQPRVTPLPDEPLGESIAFSPDGATYVTVSETSQTEGLKPAILRYTPAKAAPPKQAAQVAGGGKGDARSWFDKLTLQQITYIIGAVGGIGFVLVAMGVLGIILGRRRRPPAEPEPVGFGKPGGQPIGGAAAGAEEAAAGFAAPMSGDGYGYAQPRPTGSVYGGGTYRSGQDDFSPDRDQPRPAGVYGGGQYPSAGRSPYEPPPPEPDYDHAPYRRNSYAGSGGGAGSDDWNASQPAGRYRPPEPGYGEPEPRYGYDDDRDVRGRF